MELRELQYFLVVAREGTISAAAKVLHVAQPSLSRQMHDLERELGVTLFERGNRHIVLTEEGRILRKRAEQMLELEQLARGEIAQAGDLMSGTIRIGAGETHAFHHIARILNSLREEHPNIKLSVVSGDTIDLMDLLSNGIIDAAIIYSDVDSSLYHSFDLPENDRLGVLMHMSNELVNKDEIALEDLHDRPLIVSRGMADEQYFAEFRANFNVVATYNLIHNAAILANEKVGVALGFDGLINTTGISTLRFKPLTPAVEVTGHLIWKRHELRSPVFQLFLDKLLQDAEG